MQEIHLMRGDGPLGLSIVGGKDHNSHPFGVSEPGIFVSKVRCFKYDILSSLSWCERLKPTK